MVMHDEYYHFKIEDVGGDEMQASDDAMQRGRVASVARSTHVPWRSAGSQDTSVRLFEIIYFVATYV